MLAIGGSTCWSFPLWLWWVVSGNPWVLRKPFLSLPRWLRADVGDEGWAGALLCEPALGPPWGAGRALREPALGRPGEPAGVAGLTTSCLYNPQSLAAHKWPLDV